MPKKYACIDVGLKRIGLATSLHASIITPRTAILRKNRDQAARDVD
ncbi:MAG TPA: Holliday junction resolvase RuvX, partial [Arcobacter sp.]|nr:Holliday junction resolvase RuvX [Arcobacter sp.]